MNKKIVSAGLAVGLVAGLGAGLVLDVAGSAGASGARIAASETAVDDTDGAARLQQVLQPLVDDGTLTQEQADAVIAALEAARPFGGHHGRGVMMGGRMLTIVQDTLGLTRAEIVTAVQGGQTLAELAAANGSSGEALIALLIDEVKTHLDEEVADGVHTQEEADSRLAEATVRITRFVNETPSIPMLEGRHGRHGHGPMGDWHDDGDEAGDSGSGA